MSREERLRKQREKQAEFRRNMAAVKAENSAKDRDPPVVATPTILVSTRQVPTAYSLF